MAYFLMIEIRSKCRTVTVTGTLTRIVKCPTESLKLNQAIGLGPILVNVTSPY